jgi:hypothetical protein
MTGQLASLRSRRVMSPYDLSTVLAFATVTATSPRSGAVFAGTNLLLHEVLATLTIPAVVPGASLAVRPGRFRFSRLTIARAALPTRAVGLPRKKWWVRFASGPRPSGHRFTAQSRLCAKESAIALTLPPSRPSPALSRRALATRLFSRQSLRFYREASRHPH